MPNSASSRPVRLPLLVENRKGYQNLCRMITRYKSREKEKGTGMATLEEVAEHAEGVMCLTGGEEGVLAASLARGGLEEAQKNVQELIRLFGKNNVYRRTATAFRSHRRAPQSSGGESRGKAYTFLFSQRTAFVTRILNSVKFSMFLPAFAITASSKPRAGFWNATTNGICVPRKK